MQWIEKEKIASVDLVVIFEDIVDTGETINLLAQDAALQGKDIAVATLLSKRRQLPGVRYFLFGQILAPEAFVYGFGMDDDHLGRHHTAVFRKGSVHDQAQE